MDNRNEREQQARWEAIDKVRRVASGKEKLTEETYQGARDAMTYLLNQLSEENKGKDLAQRQKVAAVQKQIVQVQQELDRLYVRDVLQPNATNHDLRTFLITRHGKSGAKEKGGGLNPNAPVSEEALDAMKLVTQIIVSGLVDDQTDAILSTMVRALQSGAAIIPDPETSGVQIASVSIDPHAAESSGYASGKNILSEEDFVVEGGALKQAMMGAAKALYSGEELAKRKQQRAEALQGLAKKVTLDTSQDLPGIDISDEKKIAYLHNKVAQMQPNRTLWMIGHGKISTKFERAEFNFSEEQIRDEDPLGGFIVPKGELFDETNFDYGETKKIIYYKNDKNEDCAFLPAYSYVINQETGLFEAKIVKQLDLKVEYSAQPTVQQDMPASSAATASTANTSSSTSSATATVSSTNTSTPPPRPSTTAPMRPTAPLPSSSSLNPAPTASTASTSSAPPRPSTAPPSVTPSSSSTSSRASASSTTASISQTNETMFANNATRATRSSLKYLEVLRDVINDNFWIGKYSGSSMIGIDKLMRPPIIKQLADVVNNNRLSEGDILRQLNGIIKNELENPGSHNAHDAVREFLEGYNKGMPGLRDFIANYSDASSKPGRKNS